MPPLNDAAPLKLLTINIISAQDLPPVSKMLRTFVVAYIHPDHKLTTKVDHQGHTNPTWNYKVVFQVDDKFLNHESSAITIEIYNVAWLRDLPIGTTRLFINNLSPSIHKNSNFKCVSLKISRPSGHLQGTLNLGVLLVDEIIPGGEMNVSTATTRNDKEEINRGDPIQEHNENVTDQDNEGEILKDQRSNKDESLICSTTPESRKTIRTELDQHETKSFVTSTGSAFSAMRPLPSEVAEDMKKGLYSAEWNDYGSSVFENWTETGDTEEDRHRLVAESVHWPVMDEERIPLRHNDKSRSRHRTTTRGSNSTPKGVLSFFAKANGFQFSFVCGSKSMKKKRDKYMKENLRSVSLP